MATDPPNPTPRLTLLVLRCADLTKGRLFYEALGLHFVEEQHGKGPLHLAANLDGLIFELYPASAQMPATSSTRLGFSVANLQETIAALLSAGGEVLSPAQSTPWGYRAVLADPDQHRVELLQDVAS